MYPTGSESASIYIYSWLSLRQDTIDWILILNSFCKSTKFRINNSCIMQSLTVTLVVSGVVTSADHR